MCVGVGVSLLQRLFLLTHARLAPVCSVHPASFPAGCKSDSSSGSVRVEGGGPGKGREQAGEATNARLQSGREKARAMFLESNTAP